MRANCTCAHGKQTCFDGVSVMELVVCAWTADFEDAQARREVSRASVPVKHALLFVVASNVSAQKR